MSGLILPGGKGSGTPPPDDAGRGGQGGASGSGLVLPSSAGRKKEAPAQAASTPEAPAAPAGLEAAEAAGAGAPGAGGARGARRVSVEDLLIPPQMAQVQCPNCGTPFPVAVFSIIDLGVNPELKQPLLGGQVNIALCPNCGAGGALSTPLMVHVPEKQWLGVFFPPEARINEVQRQKMIGDLTQTLMRKLPQEQRKGYMLQPRQYMDWNRFSEQLWEFEGVTAEMLRRQRQQTDLLQSLLGLADDRKALELALGRSGDLIDRQFFALMDRLMVMMASQGGGRETSDRFMALRSALLEMTPAGKEVAAQQERITSVLRQIRPEMTRAELIEMLVGLWQETDGPEVGGAVIMALPTLFDYQFLLELSERLEASDNEAEKAALTQMRDLVVGVQENLQQTRQMSVEEAQQVLQEVLQAPELDQALRDNAELIDELFLQVLAANIQQAERNNSKGAARRLRQVYDAAIAMLQEGLPPEMQLANRMVAVAHDKAALNALLEENRDQLTPAFMETLRSLETEMRAGGRTELADLVKSVRGQVALKM